MSMNLNPTGPQKSSAKAEAFKEAQDYAKTNKDEINGDTKVKKDSTSIWKQETKNVKNTEKESSEDFIIKNMQEDAEKKKHVEKLLESVKKEQKEVYDKEGAPIKSFDPKYE